MDVIIHPWRNASAGLANLLSVKDVPRGTKPLPYSMLPNSLGDFNLILGR